MGDMLNRTTLQSLTSVNTPDYDEAEWLVNPDLSALDGVPRKYWKVVGDAVVEMDATEKESVDAVELLVAKLEKVYAMKDTLTAYVARHYDEGTQRTMIAYLAEAAGDGKPNRRNYIKTSLDWVQTCIVHFYMKKGEVEAATTAASVDAVALALAAFDATDPGITVSGALAITD